MHTIKTKKIRSTGDVYGQPVRVEVPWLSKFLNVNVSKSPVEDEAVARPNFKRCSEKVSIGIVCEALKENRKFLSLLISLVTSCTVWTT